MKIPNNLYEDLKNPYLFKDNRYYEIGGIDFAMNTIKVFPIGGGFQSSLKINSDFIKDYEEKVFQFVDTVVDTLLKGKFTFDAWEKKSFIDGYYFEHQRWNGWREPYLTLEGVKRFNKIQKKEFGKDWELNPSFIFKDEKVFYDDKQDDPFEIEPVSKGVPNLLYDCGLGLTWDLYTDLYTD